MVSDGVVYEPLCGDLHRHGLRVHADPHSGQHAHQDDGRGRRNGDQHDHDQDGHGQSHGLVGRSIKRSRQGLRAVGLSLAALVQTVIFIASGSIALLADVIRTFGDAATAIPLGIAFLLRSERAERYAGLFVVAAIFISACVAGVEAVSRLINPQEPTHLWALAAAGMVGFGATGSQPSSVPTPGGVLTARRSSPTATTPAPTPI